ncbi:MAG: hypothetical protein H0W76_15805 [Pyrinomonadaceae bacterium]|nr:hypothetical protein [Pyrinomonadaceae bacterium]
MGKLNGNVFQAARCLRMIMAAHVIVLLTATAHVGKLLVGGQVNNLSDQPNR